MAIIGGNEFIDYILKMGRYNVKDIQLSFLGAVIISAICLLVCSLLYNKLIKDREYKKQFILCGFLIALIYNLIVPFMLIGVSHYVVLSYVISVFVGVSILIGLLFVESVILRPFAEDRSKLIKYLIWQGVIVFLGSLVLRRILYIVLKLAADIVLKSANGI